MKAKFVDETEKRRRHEAGRIAGRSFICLCRQSDAQDGRQSVTAQLKYLRDWGQEQGGTYVDAVILAGVSGSRPGARTDLNQLIARKRSRNDFDTVLVQVADRLTRAGDDHAKWMTWELKRAGIRLIYAGEADIPDGEYGGMILSGKHAAARSLRGSSAFGAARG